MRRSIKFALLALPLAGFPANAQRPLITAIPPTEEACYGRTYDERHLAANPQQTIVEIFVGRLHTGDPELEYEPLSRERSIAEAVAGETGQLVQDTTLRLAARLREPRGWYRGLVHCRSRDGAAISCTADCDGGGFSGRVRASEATLRFGQYGVRVGPGCGEGGNVNLGSRPADRNVRLTRLPVAACIAAREAARPDWVRHGRPLRHTLPEGGTTCFARSFDADHLARTPEQQVVSMALAATRRGDVIDISLTARLRDGSRNRVTTQCNADSYEFSCEASDAPAVMRLRRGPNGGVILRGDVDPQTPSNGQESLATALDLELGLADEEFQLEPSDAQACAEQERE